MPNAVLDASTGSPHAPGREVPVCHGASLQLAHGQCELGTLEWPRASKILAGTKFVPTKYER
jgi:hypothetical protein